MPVKDKLVSAGLFTAACNTHINRTRRRTQQITKVETNTKSTNKMISVIFPRPSEDIKTNNQNYRAKTNTKHNRKPRTNTNIQKQVNKGMGKHKIKPLAKMSIGPKYIELS